MTDRNWMRLFRAIVPAYFAAILLIPHFACLAQASGGAYAFTSAAITAQSSDQTQLVTNTTAGSDICAKIETGIAAGPSSGVNVDATSFTGAQSCSSNPFKGVTKPVTLRLGPVTITTSAEWYFVNYPLRLIGIGRGVTMLAVNSNIRALTVATNSYVSHMTFQGSNNATHGASIGINSGSASNVVIEDVEVKQFATHGINTGGNAHKWKFIDLWIHDNKLDGILLAQERNNCSDGHTGTNLHIYNNGAIGWDNAASYTTLSNSYIYNNGLTASSPDQYNVFIQAVPGCDASYNSVSDSVINDAFAGGVTVRCVPGQQASYNTIVGNKIYNNGRGGSINQGVVVQGSSGACTMTGNAIRDNTISNNIGYGVSVEGFTTATVSKTQVTGNILFGNTVADISVTNGGGTNSETLVVGNRMSREISTSGNLTRPRFDKNYIGRAVDTR
jgi:hypothetical protein